MTKWWWTIRILSFFAVYALLYAVLYYFLGWETAHLLLGFEYIGVMLGGFLAQMGYLVVKQNGLLLGDSRITSEDSPATYYFTLFLLRCLSLVCFLVVVGLVLYRSGKWEDVYEGLQLVWSLVEFGWEKIMKFFN